MSPEVSSQLLFSAFLIASVALFIAGISIAVGGRREPRRMLFGSMLSTASIWMIVFALWHEARDLDQALSLIRAVFVVGSVLPTLLFLFSLTFLPKKAPTPLVAIAFLPNLVVSWVAYFTDTLVKESRNGAGFLVAGDAWRMFALHYALFFVMSIGVFLLASRKNASIDKTVLSAVLTGCIVSVNAVFSALYGSTAVFNRPAALPWLSVAALVGGLVVVALFIFQDRLLVDLRIVGVELIILLAIVIFFVDFVVASDSAFEFAFRLVLLAMLLVYGGMTTRAFVAESQRINENMSLHDQLIKANGRLIEADRLKTKFVSFVAHQLKSPLAAVHTYLTMAKDGEFGRITPKLSGIIDVNLDAISNLINTTQTFLNVTRIEMGKTEIFKSETTMANLIDRVVGEMLPLATKKGLTLNIDVPENMPSVMCDQSKLFHVILNLVDNAIKYTKSGSVTVSARIEDGDAVVRVRDTGMGLSKQDREGLFGIFERGVSAVNLQSKGEGLGLYIIKQFVEAHGGRVFFESAGPGKGSEFGFRVPAA